MTYSFPYFVDAHCHLFSISDIPLWKPVSLAADVHPINGLFGGAFVGVVARKRAPDYKPFIQYFEREQKAGAIDFAEQVGAAQNAVGIQSEMTICTPLIMDFDIGGDVSKYKEQVARLQSVSTEISGMKILPFLGIDPRRHVYGPDGRVRNRVQMLAHFDEYLAGFGVKPREERADPGTLNNGEIIGIKLYPPLGFDLLPKKAPLRARHLDLYRRIVELKLPVTVHCQPASFNLVNSTRAKSFMSPDKWKDVLEGLGDDPTKLVVNFGHYGGDRGIGDLLPRDFQFGGTCVQWKYLRKASWTHKITRLLQNHPNTYADISAINFAPKAKNQEDLLGLSGLLWLLKHAHDKSKDSSKHSVFDKLLWGSDFPMPLTEAKNYTVLLERFIHAYSTLPDKRSGWYPKKDELPSLEYVLRKLCCENPMRFLFGMNV